MAEIHDSTDARTSEAGDFECNICLDLAQDPVITLCGHLYCWPCLYRWLRGHSQSHECPVCKALIEEEKLVPLYGRGKTPTDPRTRPVTGIEVPSRPQGQRPQTALPLLSDTAFGRIDDFVSIAPPSGFSGFRMSSDLVGVLSPVFRVQFHQFGGYGGSSSSSGYHYGNPGSSVGDLSGETGLSVQADDENWKKIAFFILVLCFLFC